MIAENYKTEVITNDMNEEEKTTRVLERVVDFRVQSSTLLSWKTMERIVGNDAYTALVLDAIVMSLECESPEEVIGFIRRELQERYFEPSKKRRWWQKLRWIW